MNTLRYKKIFFLYIVLCCVLFTVLGFRGVRSVYHGSDFVDVYAGARCLLHNCDPYNMPSLAAAYWAADGSADVITPHTSPFLNYMAVYPPTAFFAALPFALFPWPLALHLWLALIAVLYSAAALCVAEICLLQMGTTAGAQTFRMTACAVLLLGAHLVFAKQVILSGQPASVAIGLAVIAAWCLVREKFIGLGILFFALSLLLKPQIAAALWLYFVLTPKYRRRAWRVLALAAAVAAAAVVCISAMPMSHHWFAELRANLSGITAHGQMNDPGPANLLKDAYTFVNLQALFSVVRDQPGFYDPITFLLVLLMFAAWIIGLRRSAQSAKSAQSLPRDIRALSAIAAISMLPVYHRAYDIVIVLLLLPAVAATALPRMRHASTALLLLLAAASFFSGVNTNYVLWVNHHGWTMWDGAHLLRSLALTRNLPILVFLIAAVLLLQMCKEPALGERAAEQI